MRTRVRRPTIRRAVVQLPNGFTLFNLFCGIFAIVLSSRLNFGKAALFVFLGGIADALYSGLLPAGVLSVGLLRTSVLFCSV